jgi:chromosome segregation ATPase
MIGHSIDKLGYDKSPEVYPEHFKVEYAKVEPMLNIFSNQGVGLRKISELEAKIQEKESVIQSLIQNGHQKATEMDELKAKVAQIEKASPRLKRCLNEYWSLRVNCQKARNKRKDHSDRFRSN